MNCSCLPGRRRAGQDEDAGADDGADTKRNQAPRTQRLAQPPLRTLRDAAISASMLRVRREPRLGIAACALTYYRLRVWPLTICLTFFFMEPRATVDARFAFGAAFLRAARFSFLRSSVDSVFFVFIVYLLSGLVRPAYFSTSFFNP